MKTRLIATFILIGLLPLLAATIFSYAHSRRVMQGITQTAEKSLGRQVGDQLQAVRDLTRERIEDYFSATINQCLNITHYPFLVSGTRELIEGTRKYRDEHNLINEAEVDKLRKELWATYQNDFTRAYKDKTGAEPENLAGIFGKLDSEAIVLQHFYITDNPNPIGKKFLKDTSLTSSHTCTYGRAHLTVHANIRRLIDSYGYAGFLLINAEDQRIVYTYGKEIDFGTSLREGPFADTALAEAVRQVIQTKQEGEYVYTRYKIYLPGLGEPEAFIASGVYDQGKLIGVAAIKLSPDGVNRIMQTRAGLGKSGEAYLVGPEYLLRSNASKEVHGGSEEYTVLNSFHKNLMIKTEPVSKALAGEAGVGTALSYYDTQTPRLCAWTPVDIAKGTRWALVAEMAEPEAMALARQIDAQGKAAAHGLLRVNGGILLAALIIISLVATWVARRLSTPLNRAAGNLQEMVSRISSATTQLASAGSETAASISETSATVEEIRQTAHVSTEKAQGVEHAAREAVQVSATGRQAVHDAIEGMHAIEQRMETIAESIVHLSEQCQAIGEIIAAINDLADQSNLLAVNASIEAAKAGEEGRGFAVVAQEVRNLAEQSKQATAQVKTILRDIQKATTGAVMATEEGGKAVATGVRQSEATGQAIEELAQRIEQAAQAAIQIAATSQQQLIGMDQMAMAMENINQATGQNVDSARQMEDTAHKLDQLGRELLDLVEGRAHANGRSH